MERAEVESRLEHALAELRSKDHHLFVIGASEWSVAHWLAVHLIELFPDHDIDCEYTRDLAAVKRLWVAQPQQDGEEVAFNRQVRPDIIVHRRGRNDHNLLVIELKKADSAVGTARDVAKLQAFLTGHLQYGHAVQLTIGLDYEGKPLTQALWVATPGAAA